MSRNLTHLLSIAHIDVQFNYHQLFKETAAQVIEAKPREYGNHAKDMAERNTIIRVQANPFDIPAEFVVYHWDFDKALTEILKDIKKWKPSSK